MTEDTQNKKSFDISKEGSSTIIKLSPALYPKNVVIRAAYRLLSNYVVWVGGDGIENIVVKIKPQEEKEELDENIMDLFFVELLQASMEEMQAERYAQIRNALVSTAINALNISNLTGKNIDDVIEELVGKNDSAEIKGED